MKNPILSNKLHRILSDFKKQMPDCWKMLEKYYLSKGVTDYHDWPDWCFVPLSAFVDIIHEYQIDNAHEAVLFASLATWRYSQDMIRFDDDVYEQLVKTGVPNKFPTDILFRMPAWSVFIETPKHDEWDGFFVFLNEGIGDKRPMMFVCTINKDDTFGTFMLYLDAKSLDDSIQDAVDESIQLALECEPFFDHEKTGLTTSEDHIKAEDVKSLFNVFLPLIIYICSDSHQDSEPQNYPSYPTVTKTKKGPRLFPAKKIRYQNIGSEFGDKIRAYDKNISAHVTGSSKAPHIRRAHWHGYWKGKRDSKDRRFIYHWLPPVFVGDDE